MNPEIFNIFVYYLNERERIRQAKLTGEKFPWSEDSILNRFSFTNVLREHDRTSQWVNKNWYLPHRGFPLEAQLMNCAIFRYFGTLEFAEAIGWSSNFDKTRGQEIKNIATERLLARQTVFTGAYVITNQGISAPKQEVVVDIFLTLFADALPELVKVAQETQSWERVCYYLMKLQGFGGTGFMAKEVIQDAMFTDVLPRDTVLDRWTWSPAGPGAQRGLNRLHGRFVDDRVPPAKAVKEMRELYDLLLDKFEPHMDIVRSQFDLHAVQFSLCELDKYMRVKLGEGKPRKTYRPGRHS